MKLMMVLTFVFSMQASATVFFSQRAKRANFIEPPGDSELPLTAKAYVDEARALLRRTGVVSPQVEQYLMTWAWNDYLDLLFSRRGNPAPLDKNLFPETLVTVLDSETMLLFYEGYMNINRYLDYRLRGLDHGDRLEYIQAKIEYTKRHFTNQRITDMVIGRNLENFVTRYTVRSTDSFEQDRERLAALVQLSSDTAHRNRILAHFDNLRYTQEGSLMPDAVFKDAQGNPVRLQDFAGKYVYIDLWASWCVPCIREIPHLQQLEKQYNSEDIVFVSISLDEDKKAWHNKMAELNLSGHQWELGESRYDKVMNVVGIPHFLLYGPDGRLIKYRATRPSSPETTKLFDSLF